MKASLLFGLLALIPTLTLQAEDLDYHRLEGRWYDYESGYSIEIKDHRKGLRVRETDRYRKRGWNTYYGRRGGVFDDCDGRLLIVVDRYTLKWINGRHRRPIYLERYRRDHYRPSYDRNGYTDRFDTRRSRRDLYGSWYCADQRVYLDIERYGNGFRAREPRGDWTYYDRLDDRSYADRRGNRYQIYDDHIEWRSKDGRRKLKFNKRE